MCLCLRRGLNLASFSIVTTGLALPNIWIPVATDEHLKIITSLIPACKGASGLIHDAHLAALALAQGLIVFSADGDFARFSRLLGVRWKNALS